MSRQHRVGAAALAAALLAAGLGGCTSLRDNLGTSSGNCYVALPNAVLAVHGGGRLEGARLENLAALRTPAPLLYAAARSAPGPAVQRVCLVAFTGQFSAASVELPVGRHAGPVAVVELAYPGSRVLATLLARHSPVRVGHSHVGVP